jgi:Arc/MetJ-type ribon-helix-helix transcriptional regulator
MNVSLGPTAEELIQQKLESGQYSSPEDVVLAGPGALDRQAQDDFAPGELDALIAQGEASLQAHGPIPAEQVFEELRQISQQRRSRGR